MPLRILFCRKEVENKEVYREGLRKKKERKIIVQVARYLYLALLQRPASIPPPYDPSRYQDHRRTIVYPNTERPSSQSRVEVECMADRDVTHPPEAQAS